MTILESRFARQARRVRRLYRPPRHIQIIDLALSFVLGALFTWVCRW